MNEKTDPKNNDGLFTLGLSKVVERYIDQFFDLHKDVLPPSGLYERIIAEVEKPLVEITLKRLDKNQVHAARILGINRNTLRKKIRQLNISLEKLQKNT